MIRYSLLLCLIPLAAYAQNPDYKPSEKDTIISCTVANRSKIAGPFSDTHPADFEKLATTVFDRSPFPAFHYYMFRTNDPAMLRIGRHLYDELDYHSFFLYNLDSASVFNTKARTRFGLISVVAHEVAHHAFNHFMPWPHENLSHQELQADYFAGWLLAKLNVPKADITKGMEALMAEAQNTAAYPSRSERQRAMALGYDVSTTAGAGPLELLANGKPPTDAWLKKWCRIAQPSDRTSPLAETTFSNKLELDGLGQLRYQSNGTTYVIARAMPSKDKLFAYLLFDNQFNYWWVERDGTIKSSNKDEALGKVDLSIVGR
ncbi:MAG: ImmA/IrrE family metallo-endopeptidase [Cyclobacteriaceae bacterium]